MKVKCNNDIDFPFQTKMSTTSQKHRNFVAEPMNEKPVTDLAGIGEVLGKRLESKGFDKAYVVLGQVRTQSYFMRLHTVKRPLGLVYWFTPNSVISLPNKFIWIRPAKKSQILGVSIQNSRLTRPYCLNTLFTTVRK